MAALPRTRDARPAYLDGLFNSQPTHQQQRQIYTSKPLPLPPRPSARSRTPSLTRSQPSPDSAPPSRSDSLVDLTNRLNTMEIRTLTPALEESDDEDDTRSIRSVRSFTRSLRPRLKLKTSLRDFHRRTYPSAQQKRPESSGSTSPSPASGILHGRKSSSNLLDKHAPPVPSMPLNCHRCYYFAARHCNGWVMGGKHGDACETCLVSPRCCRQGIPWISLLTLHL
jgi:hypothetical protein